MLFAVWDHVGKRPLFQGAREIRFHFFGEFHDAVDFGVQRVVPAAHHVLAWMDFGPALTDKNLPCRGCLAVADFDSKTLGDAIAAKGSRTCRFFMCHIL